MRYVYPTRHFGEDLEEQQRELSLHTWEHPLQQPYRSAWALRPVDEARPENFAACAEDLEVWTQALSRAMGCCPNFVTCEFTAGACISSRTKLANGPMSWTVDAFSRAAR